MVRLAAHLSRTMQIVFWNLTTDFQRPELWCFRWAWCVLHHDMYDNQGWWTSVSMKSIHSILPALRTIHDLSAPSSEHAEHGLDFLYFFPSGTTHLSLRRKNRSEFKRSDDTFPWRKDLASLHRKWIEILVSPWAQLYPTVWEKCDIMLSALLIGANKRCMLIRAAPCKKLYQNMM